MLIVSTTLRIRPDQSIVAHHGPKPFPVSQQLEYTTGILFDEQRTKIELVDGYIQLFLEPHLQYEIIQIISLEDPFLLVLLPPAFIVGQRLPFFPFGCGSFATTTQEALGRVRESGWE